MRSSVATVTAQIVTDDDPVWRAAMAAPIDDTPDTEEERAAIEEVERIGLRSVPAAVVSAEIARRSA